MKTIIISIVLALAVATPILPASASEPQVRLPLAFDHYYTYEMMVEALRLLGRAYPQLAKLEVVGKSEEGRDIPCLVVTNPKTGPELEKPGVYVDGNIHGNEVQAGEVCLYLLQSLLQQYGHNPEITRLVDKNSFYVVPCVNVDGRYHFFVDANHPSSGRSIRIPRDDDQDGLVDEDPYDDLDGDGNICRMRRRDPFGDYKTDPEDPRLMIRVKPGERGEWTLLGYEGIDNDGDGRINEDTEGYVDGNRNWSYDWQPNYVQSGAGSYPFEGIGLKALAAYLRSKPNIAVGWSFHNNGGMYLRGPSARTQGEFPPQDVRSYDYLGEQAERITPGYRYMIVWKDLYTTHGDSIEWLVMLQGAYGFVGELYQTEAEAFKTLKEQVKKKEAASDEESEEGRSPFQEDNAFERERLGFSDNLAQGELFVPWHPFKHPLYGDVEIGGWAKMSSRLPTPFLLQDLVHRNASVVLFTAKHTPEISLEVLEVKKIGARVSRLRVRLANAKAIPSMSAQAVKVKLYPQDILKVSGKGIKVNAGGPILDIDSDRVAYKEHKPELQFLTVPGFGKVEYQFLISGSGPVEIAYRSRHAGKITRVVNIAE